MKVGFNKTALMGTCLGLFTRARRTVPGQGTWQTTLQPRDLDGDGEPEASTTPNSTSPGCAMPMRTES